MEFRGASDLPNLIAVADADSCAQSVAGAVERQNQGIVGPRTMIKGRGRVGEMMVVGLDWLVGQSDRCEMGHQFGATLQLRQQPSCQRRGGLRTSQGIQDAEDIVNLALLPYRR